MALVLTASVLLMGQAAPNRTMEANEFILKDNNGKVRGSFAMSALGLSMTLADANEKTRVFLSVSENGPGLDRHIESCLEEWKAPPTINRGTRLLTQAFRPAVERNRLIAAPKIRRLSEKGNARQGFFDGAEFEAVVSFLPEHLEDFARFGYFSGWRIVLVQPELE